MKEQIEKIDRLLARVAVQGDSVLLLADARMALGQLYREVSREEAEKDG